MVLEPTRNLHINHLWLVRTLYGIVFVDNNLTDEHEIWFAEPSNVDQLVRRLKGHSKRIAAKKAK